MATRLENEIFDVLGTGSIINRLHGLGNIPIQYNQPSNFTLSINIILKRRHKSGQNQPFERRLGSVFQLYFIRLETHDENYVIELKVNVGEVNIGTMVNVINYQLPLLIVKSFLERLKIDSQIFNIPKQFNIYVRHNN